MNRVPDRFARWCRPALLFAALPALAELDAGLLQQAERWKTGESPPPKLLSFPEGKIADVARCGLGLYGSQVGDYLSQVTRPDLLEALLLDGRAQPDTSRAATRQLLTLKGTSYVAQWLAGHPAEAQRSDLAVLRELLRSPYVPLQVAVTHGKDMGQAAAEGALQAMRDALEAGTTWQEAYRQVAAQHPAPKDPKEDPRVERTLICYLYEGVVSPTGFDILSYAPAPGLLPEHLQEFHRSGQRTQIFKTADAVYLYYRKSP